MPQPPPRHDEADHEVTGAGVADSRRNTDRRRIMRIANNIAEIRGISPEDPEQRLTPEELARKLTYDVLNTLSRAEWSLELVVEPLAAHTEQLRIANALRTEEVDLLRRDVVLREQAAADQRSKSSRLWSWVERAVKAGGDLAGRVLFNPRTEAAIIGLIMGALTVLAGWLGLG